MPESTFIPKIEAACRKKEALFDTSKAKYAVRSIFAGAFLTFSTGAGAIAADLTNKIVPGTGRFSLSFHLCLGIGLHCLSKCRVGDFQYDVSDCWYLFEED